MAYGVELGTGVLPEAQHPFFSQNAELSAAWQRLTLRERIDVTLVHEHTELLLQRGGLLLHQGAHEATVQAAAGAYPNLTQRAIDFMNLRQRLGI
jgi:hypothetical protein